MTRSAPWRRPWRCSNRPPSTRWRSSGRPRRRRRQAEAERARSEVAKAEAARQLADVVDGIGRGLDQLAAGALTFRLKESFAAEYEKLRTDFNGAMAKLADTLTVVATNTSAIRSGTGEISTAADDLSRRTEQQAASLEETAAALDEVTATVKKTSQSANHARDVVGAAKSGAEHSGQVVRRAVEAMTAIERSSTEIGQIIGVIDEIAFQTNLLALNAGVEAARAGEAGRGFAVVASEVRALAQRSAEAAKEIKALITTSREQVGQGVGLVGDTGQALERILGQVVELASIVTEIAASAQEQAAGLDQINTAINQMDQVTQQNAAMVEQSTAASHALSRETEELSSLVGRFQLGTGSAAMPRRAPPRSPPRRPDAHGRPRRRGPPESRRRDRPRRRRLAGVLSAPRDPSPNPAAAARPCRRGEIRGPKQDRGMTFYDAPVLGIAPCHGAARVVSKRGARVSSEGTNRPFTLNTRSIRPAPASGPGARS